MVYGFNIKEKTFEINSTPNSPKTGLMPSFLTHQKLKQRLELQCQQGFDILNFRSNSNFNIILNCQL